MDINEIEAGWGEEVYIWVRPANDLTWHDINQSALGHQTNRAWQPARVTGFVDADRRGQYGTGADSRRVWLLGTATGFDVSKFEFGLQIRAPGGMFLANDEEVSRMPGLSR